MFGALFGKKGLKNPNELSKFIDEAYQGLDNRIHNQQQFYTFIMEDADGASQGNEIAKHHVESLGLFNVEYDGALHNDSIMDNDDSALEYLNNVISPSLIKDLGLETAIIMALLQITIDDKLNSFLAKGSVYESLPWSAFSGRNHSLGCTLVL